MKVFVLGSGPDVEGQVCALSVRALKDEGHEVVLLDPNPATVATDPGAANRTYLEPLTLEAAQRVLAAEKPDAILAGIGRKATELALALLPSLHGVRWLGPSPEALAARPGGEADVVIEMVRTGGAPIGTGDARLQVAAALAARHEHALTQIEQRGQTWICPAPNHRPELDALAGEALAKLGFVGCARVRFFRGALVGIDPVVGASSAFVSRALGASIPRLAVKLALGLPVGALPPKPSGIFIRSARDDGSGEMMTAPVRPSAAPGRSVLILGPGPTRVGQGPELDWAVSHAEEAIRATGLEPIVVDASPGALSGASSVRYFEPATLDAVLDICRREQPRGVIVQLGGRAALAIAPALEAAGVTVLGTAGAALSRTLDRVQFAAVVKAAGLQQPALGTAATLDEAKALAARIGYPVLARAGAEVHYVSGPTALERRFVPGVSLQAFLNEATQADVELLRDATGKVVIAGVLEHVEQAGVHTGDAACTLPPHSLKSEVIERLKDAATALAQNLEVVGLLNVHCAVQGKTVWVLEANPRASRMLPFVSKATGLMLPRLATQLMLGRTLAELGLTEDPVVAHCAVRESVFSENVALGPNMRSLGEVMAVAESLAVAFGKSQLAAGTALPDTGTVFLSVQDDDKPAVVDLAQRLIALGFALRCTAGTRAYLQRKGVPSTPVRKVSEGPPHVAELIREGGVQLVIRTSTPGDSDDGQEIRQATRERAVPNFTTVEAARMAVGALEARAASRAVVPLQAFAQAR